MKAFAYRVVDWDQTFENAQSRKVDNCSWVAVPACHDTTGYRRVISAKRGPEVYAAWVLMLEVAVKAPKPRDGLLVSNGAPITAADLALRTGAPRELFERAFKVLSDPAIGWLERVPRSEWEHAPGKVGAVSDPSVLEGNGTERNGREGKADGGGCAPPGKAKDKDKFHVSVVDLRDRFRFCELLGLAHEAGYLNVGCEADIEFAFSAMAHALRIGKAPDALFASLIRDRRAAVITQADEDAGRAQRLAWELIPADVTDNERQNGRMAVGSH